MYWTLFQYPMRRLIIKSRKVSKPRDLYFKLCDRSEIWQAPGQQCCRGAYHISKRFDNLNYQSHGFETSRDVTIRCFIGYWNVAQVHGRSLGGCLPYNPPKRWWRPVLPTLTSADMALSPKVLLGVMLFLCSKEQVTAQAHKTYIIDLDAPPVERWVEVGRDNPQMGPVIKNLTRWVALWSTRSYFLIEQYEFFAKFGFF